MAAISTGGTCLPAGEPIEIPLLALGASGFAPTQRQTIEAALARAGSPVARWRLQPFAEGDAWFLNGRRTQLLRGGNVRVGAGLPTEHALHFDLRDVDRPVAFAQPVAAPDFQPHCDFVLEQESSIHAVLRQF